MFLRKSNVIAKNVAIILYKIEIVHLQYYYTKEESDSNDIAQLKFQMLFINQFLFAGNYNI